MSDRFSFKLDNRIRRTEQDVVLEENYLFVLSGGQSTICLP